MPKCLRIVQRPNNIDPKEILATGMIQLAEHWEVFLVAPHDRIEIQIDFTIKVHSSIPNQRNSISQKLNPVDVDVFALDCKINIA